MGTCGTVGRLDIARVNSVVDELHVCRGRTSFRADQVSNPVDGERHNAGVMLIQFLLQIGALTSDNVYMVYYNVGGNHVHWDASLCCSCLC